MTISTSPIVVTTCDRWFAKPALVCIKSLFDNSPDCEYSVSILNSNLLPFQVRWFETLARSAGRQIVFHRTARMLAPLVGRLTLPPWLPLDAYARIFIDRMIDPDVSRILYLDADVLVRRDIAPLLTWDLCGEVVAAAIEQGIWGEGLARKLERLSMSPGSNYFNSGVMIIDMARWRAEHLSDRLLTATLARSGDFELADQDALNHVLDGRFSVLPGEWNVLTPSVLGVSPLGQSIADPKIVHFSSWAQSRRPWRLGSKHPFRDVYLHYLQQTPAWGKKASRQILYRLKREIELRFKRVKI